MMKAILSILFAITFINTILAAPPANDNLAAAAILTGASGNVNGTTAEATRENGEQPHGTVQGDFVYRTVWYRWTAPETKPVRLEITSAAFDAALAVYTGPSIPSLVYKIRNNDTFGTRPRVEFAAQAGTTYNFMVGINQSSVEAGGTFNLEFAQNASPSNNNFAQPLALSGLSGSVSATTQGATIESLEPVFGDGKSVWFTFASSAPHDVSITFRTERTADPLYDTRLAVYTGSALGALSNVVKNDDTPSTFKSRVTFLAKTGVTYRIAVDRGGGVTDGDVLLDWAVSVPPAYTDFGTKLENSHVYYDEATDITVFRPSNGVWYSINSDNGAFSAFQFGLGGDRPVAAEYDGDGLTDYAVTRNQGGQKVWYIRNSFDESYRVTQWGLAGDREVPGDYDADGRTDLAVFRPSNNVWYILRSSDNQFLIREFGLAGDIPVVGDFEGTPAGSDLAVFRPSNGTWYIFDGVNTIFAPFGLAGDKPVPADYDIDGKTDLAVFRPSSGTWYFLQTSSDDVHWVNWGLSNDIPVPGDYDNNTNDKADFAVFRPADNTWYILRSEGFFTDFVKFGASGDLPVSTPTSAF